MSIKWHRKVNTQYQLQGCLSESFSTKITNTVGCQNFPVVSTFRTRYQNIWQVNLRWLAIERLKTFRSICELFNIPDYICLFIFFPVYNLHFLAGKWQNSRMRRLGSRSQKKALYSLNNNDDNNKLKTKRKEKNTKGKLFRRSLT